MPGIGMVEKILKTTKAKSTNKILLRKLLSSKIIFSLFKKFCIMLYKLYNFLLYNYFAAF